MIKVTEQPPAVTAPQSPPTAPPSTRQPVTSLMQVVRNMDNSMFEVGYDSDGAMVPFFDKFENEGPLVTN